MNKRCEDCIKNDVCKYINEFDEFIKEKEMECDKDFIEVNVKCKFKSTETTYVWRGPHTIPLTTPATPTTPYQEDIVWCGGDTDSKSTLK